MAGPPRRVVIIEDDPVTRDLFALALGDEGYVCDRVSSAEQAIPLLADADVLVADLAGARDIAAELVSVRRPLVIVSADASAADYASGIGARYLAKPFELDTLSEALRQILGGSEGAPCGP